VRSLSEGTCRPVCLGRHGVSSSGTCWFLREKRDGRYTCALLGFRHLGTTAGGSSERSGLWRLGVAYDLPLIRSAKAKRVRWCWWWLVSPLAVIGVMLLTFWQLGLKDLVVAWANKRLGLS
jgi:hypothetical protein